MTDPASTGGAAADLHEVCGRSWDAVVVGAGPGGGLLARELAQQGIRTLLVDKAGLARPKVCGSCLNDVALNTMERVGLGDLVSSLGGRPLTMLELQTRGHLARIPLPRAKVISRERLDAALVGAAVRDGATFLSGTVARYRRSDGHGVLVALRQGRISAGVEARVVVAADGVGGSFLPRIGPIRTRIEPRSRVGAGAILEMSSAGPTDGVVRMVMGRGGYLGMVRLEDGRVNLAAAVEQPQVRRAAGLGPAVVSIVEEAGDSVAATLAGVAWRGTPPLTRRPTSVADRRLFVIGDAAGYVEPFTGEGIGWSMMSAAALAPLAAQAVESWRDDLTARWIAWHRRHVRRRQRLCAMLATGLRSGFLTRAVVGLLSCVPELAGPLTHHVSRSNRRLRAAER